MMKLGLLSILISLQFGYSPEVLPTNLRSNHRQLASVALGEIPSLSLQDKEQQAKQLYEMGRLTEAMELLAQLEAEYTAQADATGRMRVLRNLALIYQDAGDLSKATEAITQSLDILQSSSTPIPNSTLALAKILDIKAGLHLATGQTELALEDWQTTAQLYKRLD